MKNCEKNYEKAPIFKGDDYLESITRSLLNQELMNILELKNPTGQYSMEAIEDFLDALGNYKYLNLSEIILERSTVILRKDYSIDIYFWENLILESLKNNSCKGFKKLKIIDKHWLPFETRNKIYAKDESSFRENLIDSLNSRFVENIDLSKSGLGGEFLRGIEKKFSETVVFDSLSLIGQTFQGVGSFCVDDYFNF